MTVSELSSGRSRETFPLEAKNPAFLPVQGGFFGGLDEKLSGERLLPIFAFGGPLSTIYSTCELSYRWNPLQMRCEDG